QAVDHRACLRAGAAMRLLDLDALASVFLPSCRERLVEFGIELARGIVGDVEQRNVRSISGARPEQCRGDGKRTADHFGFLHRARQRARAYGSKSAWSGFKSTKVDFLVGRATTPLCYEALIVWMPHSVLPRPRQRPARASSLGALRLVQGIHPTDRKPDATNGCGGKSALLKIASISSRETLAKGLNFSRAPSA